jgi:hypothetical protein
MTASRSCRNKARVPEIMQRVVDAVAFASRAHLCLVRTSFTSFQQRLSRLFRLSHQFADIRSARNRSGEAEWRAS